MTDAVRYPLVLGIICLSSAGGLAVSYRLTRDEIRRQEALKKAEGLAAVFEIPLDTSKLTGDNPQLPWRELAYPALKGEAGDTFTVFEATHPETKQRLYAAEGSRRGYSSPIQVIVATDDSISKGLDATTIKAVKVIDQSETPGLGTRCTAPEFQRQFDGLPYPMLQVVKFKPLRDPSVAGNEKQAIAAITGATITSNAVVESVRQALDHIRYAIEHPQPKP